MARYYALVASLRELSQGAAGAKDFDACAIRDYVREHLGDEDRQLLDFFHTWYDIENLAAVASGSDNFNPLGNLSLEQLEAELKTPESLPGYLARVVEACRAGEQNEDEAVDVSRGMTRSLYEAFYGQAARSASRFVREWYAFDRTLRNICAAVAARRTGRAIEGVVVGQDDVTAALAGSSAADFGLKGEVGYIDALLGALTEQDDLLEKERRIDALRWRQADALSEFSYFDMDAVLAYMARVALVSRWQALDPATGRAMFEQLLDRLCGAEFFEWIDKKTQA